MEHIDLQEMTDEEYPIIMSTGRMLYYDHTATMTRKPKVLPEYVPDAYVEMCTQDIGKRSVKQGEKVRISSRSIFRKLQPIW